MATPFAEFNTWETLIAALRAAREARNISFEELDRLCGVADRYCSKVLGRNPPRNVSAFSLGLIMQGLGLKAILVPDPATERRVLAAPKRDERAVRHRPRADVGADLAGAAKAVTVASNLP